MDVLAIQDGCVLGKVVQSGLVLTPVVSVGPIRHEVAYKAQRDSVLPACAGQLVRPPGLAQPLAKVIHLGLRNVDAKGSEVRERVSLQFLAPLGLDDMTEYCHS